MTSDRPGASLASESTLPSKLFFRIGEVAGLVGVEPHVLRYWEREFRSIRPTKSAKGQRVYSRKDVENLLRVRDLLYRDGFTIAGAKKRLQRGGLEAEAEADVEAEAEGSPSARSGPPGSGPPGSGPPGSGPPDSGPPDSGPPDSARDNRSENDSDDGRETDHDDPPLRQKLTALRAEVESFLGELESEGRSDTNRSERG